MPCICYSRFLDNKILGFVLISGVLSYIYSQLNLFVTLSLLSRNWLLNHFKPMLHSYTQLKKSEEKEHWPELGWTFNSLLQRLWNQAFSSKTMLSNQDSTQWRTLYISSLPCASRSDTNFEISWTKISKKQTGS